LEAAPDRVLVEQTVLLGRDMTDGLARMGLTESRAHVLWELQPRGPSTPCALAGAPKVAPRAPPLRGPSVSATRENAAAGS
jgi:hypothetical protein